MVEVVGRAQVERLTFLQPGNLAGPPLQGLRERVLAPETTTQLDDGVVHVDRELGHRASKLAAASAGAVQWVTPSGGGSCSVRVTTRSMTALGNGGMRAGRVWSRSRPSTPSCINRSCQRHTHGFDTPARRITAAVPQPSAVASMIRARQTCFCGPFRSATIASSRARSPAVTSISIPLRMAPAYRRACAKGIFR